MRWIRANLILVVFLLAVVGSFVVSEIDNRKDRAQLRIDAIESCVRANNRSALNTAFQKRTAEARRANDTPMDRKVADDYEAFAVGMSYFLARPQDVKDPLTLVAVRKEKDDFGRHRYVLTDASEALVRAGCEASFVE